MWWRRASRSHRPRDRIPISASLTNAKIVIATISAMVALWHGCKGNGAMSMYDLRLFDAANGTPIFRSPPQAQPYGAFAAGDDFFVNNNRFAITKVGHTISGPPD